LLGALGAIRDPAGHDETDDQEEDQRSKPSRLHPTISPPPQAQRDGKAGAGRL